MTGLADDALRELGADDALRGLCVVPLLLPGSPVAIKLNADCWEGGGKGKAFWKSASIVL